MKKRKGYLTTLGTIVTIVAVLHLLRAVFSLPLVVGIWDIPIWLSYVAAAVLGWLMYLLWTDK